MVPSNVVLHDDVKILANQRILLIIASQLPGQTTQLQSFAAETEIRSPDFGQVLGNTRRRWIIREQEARSVISLHVSDNISTGNSKTICSINIGIYSRQCACVLQQVVELDLPGCAMISVYDGEDSSSPLLDTISSEHNPQSVISSTNTMSIYYQSCDEHALYNMGFRLTYQTGVLFYLLSVFTDKFQR